MYKILFIAIIVPFTLMANEPINKGKFTKTKTLNKAFNVKANNTLNVQNKYGDISISTWDKNYITINVDISTSGNDEDEVKERLNDITVDFGASSNVVTAITKIKKKSNNWSWWGYENGNVDIKINYSIKMPVTNNVKLNNDYGSITIDNLKGIAYINCDYGKLYIGRLENENNNINLDYIESSNIDYMKSGAVNADYSDLKVINAENINLNANYSNISFTTIDNLNYNCDYGSLEVENAQNINGKSDYMHAKVKKLNNEGVFNSDYGSIKIEALNNKFNKLQIKSSYTHINIGVENTESFNVEANLEYTNLKKLDGFNFEKEIINGSDKYYLGYFKSPSKANVSIKSSYGSVTFN